VSGCSFVGAYSLQLELTLDADLQSCIHDGDEQAESIHCIVSEKERERKKERDKERQRKREREREKKRKKEREKGREKETERGTGQFRALYLA
jgi:hypothetical protein